MALYRYFTSQQWGKVWAQPTRYANGTLAVQLWCCGEEGGPPIEPLATLSVNLPESASLPERCFYVKDWSENEEIAAEAFASGWFRLRGDLPMAFSGHVVAEAWEMLEENANAKA